MPPGETPRLYVPIPPSVNNLFVNTSGQTQGRSRVKSQKYRNWLHEAGWRLRQQHPPHFAKPVRIEIEADLERRRDIDNALKPLLDLLVYVQVLADDNLVDDLRIRRIRSLRGEAAIMIWPMEG